MKKPTLILSGLCLALAAFSAWQWQQLNALREENAGLSGKVKKAAVTARATGPLSRPAEGTRRPEIAGADTAAKAAAAMPGRPEPTAEERARFQKMRDVRRAQRIESRLLALGTALNLTPNQKAAVQAALEKGSSERDALREAGFSSGKPPSPEQFAASEKAQEDAILATLTSDQLGAYSEYKDAEKQTRAETRASQQLNELQSSLSLTAAQKDAAYQLFADQAIAPAATSADPAKAWEEQRAATLAAMSEILSPEQYELYQKQEAERVKLFGNRGPGGPGGPPPGGGPP